MRLEARDCCCGAVCEINNARCRKPVNLVKFSTCTLHVLTIVNTHICTVFCYWSANDAVATRLSIRHSHVALYASPRSRDTMMAD